MYSTHQRAVEVPDVVVQRLPRYLRALDQLTQGGATVVSSQQLGERLQMTPAQIRKDLSYFGRFGKQGQGYNVLSLSEELRQILGLNRQWRVALVGVGRLGRAIIGYPGFAPEGFQVAAAFDSNPTHTGQEVAGLVIQPVAELCDTIRRLDIQIAIVAVPAPVTQKVVDLLVECGVRAILSYAPTTIQAPPHVRVRTIDPVLVLQSMTYYLGSVAGASPAPVAARRPRGGTERRGLP